MILSEPLNIIIVCYTEFDEIVGFVYGLYFGSDVDGLGSVVVSEHVQEGLLDLIYVESGEFLRVLLVDQNHIDYPVL